MQALRRIILLAGLTAGACNSAAEERVITDKGALQSKPRSTLANTGALSAAVAAKTVAHVSYSIDVRSVSETRLCSGSVQMQIKSNFTLVFPDAELKCASLTLDLAGILGTADFTKGMADSANFNSDGEVLSMSSLAGATFTPPRPLLLGPIIQDVSVFTDFRRSVPSSMSYRGAAGQLLSATGTFNLQVFDADTTYTNNYLGAGFDHVIHWALRAEGFDGVSGRTGLVFKKMEWIWSTRPIMIPKLIIVGDLSDFTSKSANSVATDSFIGELTIELTATAYTIGD